MFLPQSSFPHSPFRAEISNAAQLQLSIRHDPLEPPASIDQLMKRGPVLFVYFEADDDQLPHLKRKILSKLLGLQRSQDALSQLRLSPAVMERCLSVVQLVDHNSECPHVCLGSVDIVQEPFWGHVEG